MPEFLEITIDKFILRVATDRIYFRDGLWVLVLPQGRNRVRIGVTDYLQQHSGDATFVNVKPPGTTLQVGDVLAELETIKVDIVLATPVSGTIAAVNDALEHNAELVNQSPYEKGWLAEIEAADFTTDRAALLEAKDYLAFMQSQIREELK